MDKAYFYNSILLLEGKNHIHCIENTSSDTLEKLSHVRKKIRFGKTRGVDDDRMDFSFNTFRSLVPPASSPSR